MNYDVILCMLAVYVISLVVSAYAGPFDVFVWLRAKFKNGPLACFVCASFWVALIFGCLLYLNPVELFAIWGGAVTIYKLGEK